jgi:hypothetical protein
MEASGSLPKNNNYKKGTWQPEELHILSHGQKGEILFDPARCIPGLS